jgi:hypothetical protein
MALPRERHEAGGSAACPTLHTGQKTADLHDRSPLP